MQAPIDPLSRVFHALADPTRRAIIEHLSREQATVSALAGPFAISRPAVSQHLRVLEDAGLVTRTRQAQWHLCSLDPAPLEDASSWVERHRRIWTERFDALDAVLGDLQAGDRTTHEEPTEKDTHPSGGQS